MYEDKDIKKIPLTKSQFAIVDADDFERLNRFNWHVLWNGRTYYAVRSCNCPIVKQQCKILMHRQILSCPRGVDIDHRDHNSLNNRKSNIRFCTKSQNLMNGKPRGGKSKFKGVSYDKRNRYKKWHARIKLNSKRISLGYFDSEVEAAKAYDAKAKELFGEFAKFNFSKKRAG